MKDLTDPTNRDSVPAMLTPGEWVLNKEASQMFGPQLQAMNDAGLRQRAVENAMVTANDGKYILSDADKDLLIRTSLGESVGEDDKGRAGVMYTVLNRQAKNKKYWGGNSIKDIVNKNKKSKSGNTRYQFSSANPKSPAYHWYKDKINESEDYLRSKAILEGMIKGDIVDPTNGAVYFLNPVTTRASRKDGSLPPFWNNDAVHKTTLGKHVFALSKELDGVIHPDDMVKQSIVPKVRDYKPPEVIESIKPTTREYIENSSLNVPAMEGIPMYANTGASSLQTLIQSLLKGNQSSGIPKHQVKQAIKTDEDLMYGSSQSRNNILGGPGDPYGRQLLSYPPMVDAHGFAMNAQNIPFSVPATEEPKDLFEFYNNKLDVPLQKNIEANEIKVMPRSNNETMITTSDQNLSVPVIPMNEQKEPNYFSTTFPKLSNFLSQEVSGYDPFGLAPPENKDETLKIMQNQFLDNEAESYIPPVKSDVAYGPVGLSFIKETPIKSSGDFLSVEENKLNQLKEQMNSLPEGTSLKEIENLNKKIANSTEKVSGYESINIKNAIIAAKENQEVIDKALLKRKELISKGSKETDPVIQAIDKYISDVDIPTVYDAFSTNNKYRWNNAKNGPIHGSESDVRMRLESMSSNLDDPAPMPGSELEREEEFGPDPFGGASATALAQMEEERNKNPSKFDKMLESSKGVIKAAFDDVFDGQSLARAAMIYSAFRLTGASGNQAIKAAGKDYLQQVEYVNKKELLAKHIKRLKGYKTFTNSSLEVYSKTLDADDLVRIDSLNSIVDDKTTKKFYRKNEKGNWVPFIARAYTTTSDSGGTGYYTGDGKKVNLLDPNITDNPIIARDRDTPEYNSYYTSNKAAYVKTVKEELKLPMYEISEKVDSNFRGVGDAKQKKVSFFKNLNVENEADALTRFAATYNLDPATTNQIYKMALADAFAFGSREGAESKTSVAGSNVDSQFMKGAWIKVNVGDDQLFVVKPSEDGKPPVYDAPDDITRTISKFQNFKDSNGFIFSDNYRSKSMPEFSSILLSSVGSASKDNKIPKWETWRKNYVTKEDSTYKNTPNIDNWRNDNPNLAGKSEFIKYLEYVMYDLRFRGSN